MNLASREVFFESDETANFINVNYVEVQLRRSLFYWAKRKINKFYSKIKGFVYFITEPSRLCQRVILPL